MMTMRRKLACCSRDREISIDFDEQERIMTYQGLESCILNSRAYNENESATSRGDHGCASDSLDYDDDDDNSSCSSSKEAFGLFSSKWFVSKSDTRSLDDWDVSSSPKHFCVKEKPNYALKHSDIDTMKEKFSRLLLGGDITGGCNGVSSALALSNAITHLAVSVFGEMWKLEPLPEDKKQKWRREMDWLLSPTNYMIELVPAKRSVASGRTLEIMTPKARKDIHMNLPALRKLDSMLIGTLDSMVDTEFWYTEVGSRAEGRTKSGNESKRWWLPLPQVSEKGLSDSGRKKLQYQSKMVYQVFKAAQSINEGILLQMPLPSVIRDALLKSGNANLGVELQKALTSDVSSANKMLNSLCLKSEHDALEAVNKLESAIFVWKEKITAQASRKSPNRTSWSFTKDSFSELDKIGSLMDRAEALLHLLKTRYPNLPRSFLDATKIQYGKDVGHSTLEAYSRVLGNLASSILSRIADVLQEDALRNPNSLAEASCCSTPWKAILPGFVETPDHNLKVQNSPFYRTDKFDDVYFNADLCNNSGFGYSPSEAKVSSASSTPSKSLVWCIGKEASCVGVSASNSP